jgi:hypothetical protein
MIDLPIDEPPGWRVIAVQDITSFEPAVGTGTLIALRDGRSFRTTAAPDEVRAAILQVRNQFVSLHA